MIAEHCGERAPSSNDGYCPCIEAPEHDLPHRCAHGTTWGWAE